MAGGVSPTRTPSLPSVVITRNVSKAAGVQSFLPSRLLYGLLPDALLESYELWQREVGADGPAAGKAVDDSAATEDLSDEAEVEAEAEAEASAEPIGSAANVIVGFLPAAATSGVDEGEGEGGHSWLHVELSPGDSTVRPCPSQHARIFATLDSWYFTGCF